jgi:hypothetical protein
VWTENVTILEFFQTWLQSEAKYFSIFGIINVLTGMWVRLYSTYKPFTYASRKNLLSSEILSCLYSRFLSRNLNVRL